MKGPVRARDLRANIKDYGFEQGVVVTFEAFLDEFTQYRQHQRDVVEMLELCSKNIERFLDISSGMQEQLDTMRRIMKGDDSEQ